MVDLNLSIIKFILTNVTLLLYNYSHSQLELKNQANLKLDLYNSPGLPVNTKLKKETGKKLKVPIKKETDNPEGEGDLKLSLLGLNK